MIKFLYGKRERLKNLIAGQGCIRFSDIIYYGRMENGLMRDIEVEKSFVLDRESFHFELNGKRLNPSDMLEHPVLTVRTQRAFCLCLSNKLNAPELFDRFYADVCIEIDVDVLTQVLEVGFGILPGVSIEHESVNYYPPVMKGPGPDIRRALFCKPEAFSVEDEYRVAIIIPPGRILATAEGLDIELYSDEVGKEQHLYIKGYRDDYLSKVHYRERVL